MEISFQSIFSLRAGGALPRRGRNDVRTLINNAEISTLISKFVTTLFVVVFALIVFYPLTAPQNPSGPSKELAVTGSISAFLAVVLFLISFMGLQASTAFVSSKIVDVLSPLSLSKREVSNIVFLCFIRIFDIPLIAASVTIPLVFYLIKGSLLGGLVAFLGVVSSEIFAIALTIILARFFYSRVAGGGGKSKWQTFLRFVFMLVWIIPSFAIYFVVNFAQQLVQSFASLTQSLVFASNLFAMIYPFSFGYLVSFTMFPNQVDYIILGLSAASCVAYLALAVYSLRWVLGTVRRIGMGGFASVLRESVKDTALKLEIPWVGVIRKDLRIASRSPSYASLFLLPAVQTVLLAVSFTSLGEMQLSTMLGVLVGTSIVVLLLPPTLVSIEGLAASYTRSLPLKKRTLISAKTLLSTIIYMISLSVLVVMTLYMRRNLFYILTLGLAHSFSVAAATTVELIILANKFWKEGFAVGNLYSRLSTFILIVIPGLVVVMVPILAAIFTIVLAPYWVLAVFTAVALIEFGLAMAYVSLKK
jgi:predicted permease